MKATAVTLFALLIALFVGPAVAGPRSDVEKLGEELAGLTDAIQAQIKLLRIYEEMGKTYDLARTRLALLDLVKRQEKLLGELAAALGGTPAERPVPVPKKPTDVPFEGPAEVPPPKDASTVVARGLAWLARVQDEKGLWDADHFMPSPVDGPGKPLYDVGVTGLALLAFLGDGQTHKSGQYRKNVANGFKHLKEVQDPEGCFGPRTDGHFVYNHAIAALAMAEAYQMTGSPLFKQSAQRGADFIARAQNPYLAWRYGVRPKTNDTSVTGWMVAALAAARHAGLRTAREAFRGAMAWIDKVTEPEYGRVGYTARGTGPARPEGLLDRFPPDKSESLTAEGLVTRIHCGIDPAKDEAARKGLVLIGKRLPVWSEREGSIDMYYWYWGTMALRRVGGRTWKAWREAIEPILRSAQRRKGRLAGSFDPAGPWGAYGGRVYSTALMTMIAEQIAREK